MASQEYRCLWCGVAVAVLFGTKLAARGSDGRKETVSPIHDGRLSQFLGPLWQNSLHSPAAAAAAAAAGRLVAILAMTQFLGAAIKRKDSSSLMPNLGQRCVACGTSAQTRQLTTGVRPLHLQCVGQAAGEEGQSQMTPRRERE